MCSLGNINLAASLSANSGSNAISLYPNLSAGSSKAYITDNSTITAATYTVNGNLTVNSGKTLTLKGAVTITGTLTTASGSLVRYAGALAQTIKAATYYDLTIDTTDGAKTVYFDVANTTVVTNALVLTGASGKVLTIRSTVPATRATITVPITSGVDYVNVDYNNASNSITTTNSNIGSNTTNWI